MGNGFETLSEGKFLGLLFLQEWRILVDREFFWTLLFSKWMNSSEYFLRVNSRGIPFSMRIPLG
jgi:hypothetical protein